MVRMQLLGVEPGLPLFISINRFLSDEKLSKEQIVSIHFDVRMETVYIFYDKEDDDYGDYML